MSILITGLPRSGTSLVANLISTAGYSTTLSGKILGASEFNKQGYSEDIEFILLNDQMIRLYYGKDRSFLNPPSNYKEIQNNKESNFIYDITSATLELPDSFEENIDYFCPCGWDSWGLTRMMPGRKWHECYKHYNISEINGIETTKTKYNTAIVKSEKLCLKDPRLIFTLPHYSLNTSQKVILVERDSHSVLRSMRYHYGSRLFSYDKYPGYTWVSNHFNLKIPGISFSHYLDTYSYWKSIIKSKFNTLIVNYEDILSKSALPIINDFIEAKCNDMIIKQ